MIMAELITTDPENPMFLHKTPDGKRYTFSLAQVAEDARPWMMDVVGRQMHELYATAYEKGRAEVQAEIRKALGVKP